MVYFGDFKHKEPPRAGKITRYYPLVEDIERKCARTVTIETVLNYENLARCNPQHQSPLFKLPAELRSMIFYFTCLPYDHEEDKYKEEEFYYRPEHQARHITSTSLLLTCRRAWLEANHLPLQLGDHSFWFRDPGRRPKYLDRINTNEEKRLENFLGSLTRNGCQNLKHVQVYAQMIWLEEYSGSKFIQLLETVGVCPEVLTITVRYSDWWWWEYARSLRLDDGWLSKILNWQAHPRLREIRLQLEIVQHQYAEIGDKVSELRNIEMDLRSKYHFVRRVDLLGTPVRVALDNPDGVSSSGIWSGKAPYPAGNNRNASVPTVFMVTKLVWRADRDEERLEPIIAHDSTEPRGVVDTDLPILNIVQYHAPSGISRPSGSDKETTSKYEQYWSKHGSLLKFTGGA